jgi:K+-transporting ATPase KdpF subunit
MDVLYIMGASLSAGLFVYLIVAMLRPEKFS